jgi:hypothetical protein
MPKIKRTLSIDPKAWTRLEAIAKEQNRSKSNMIEIMTYFFYENKNDIEQILIRKKLDKI